MNTDPTTEPEATPTEPTQTPTTPQGNPFAITAPPTEPEPTPNNPEEPQPEQPTFTLTLDEGVELDETLSKLITQQGQALGMDAKATSSFISGIVKEIETTNNNAFIEAENSLKTDWGKDYETNLAASKKAAQQILATSGLKPEDLAPLENPQGARLLHAISQTLGEKPLAGAHNPSATQTSPAEEANNIIKDPTHKYHNALINPSHPQHKEANAYYNKLVGITQK